MGGEVGAAAIEGEIGPAATESGDAAVAVLQIKEPANAGLGGGFAAQIIVSEMMQSEQRAGGVVGVGDAAAQIGPGPSAGGGVGVGMLETILLIEKPIEEFCAFDWAELKIGIDVQGIGRESGDPRREIGVDRPGSIVANGIHEESRARVDYRFAFLSSRGVNEAHHDKTGQRRGLKKSAGLWLDRL